MIRCTSKYKLGYVNLASLLTNFDGVCPLCMKMVHCDDWVPAHHQHPEIGGKHELENIFLCCRFCLWDLGWGDVDTLIDARMEEWGSLSPAPTGLPLSKHVKKLNKLHDIFPDGYSVISL